MSLSRIVQVKTRSAILLSGARVPRFSSASALTLCLLTLLWLAGCASTNIPAPVDTREQAQKQGQRGAQKGATMHRVEKGDTLYSIAWRYDLDYHQLAGWNRIDSSYRIYPGQVLRLSVSSQPAATTAVKAPAGANITSKPKPTVVESPGRTPPPPVRKAPVVAKPPAPKPPAPKPKPKPPAPAPKPPTEAPKPTSTAASSSVLKWVWPTRGTVVQTFLQDDRTRQGIRIAGKSGQPVIAAESGKVVYTGSGLPGYGKLIIVKHNKNYLSAYGFNRKLLVKDGDQVTRGERIAEMGQSTDGKSLLHFEIRRRDSPLDPLKRLPR